MSHWEWHGEPDDELTSRYLSIKDAYLEYIDANGLQFSPDEFECLRHDMWRRGVVDAVDTI